ncbi:MAG: hypothetical protein M1839_003936 [Geoglossum umbratile]|nr:MAG: hypothetical protein M1839_003936 [Geoglossum umbratile]
MPHVPPRVPSRGEEDSDSGEFKTLLLTEKAGDIALPVTPPIPERAIFRKPVMEPEQTIFHRGQDYPPSLSDASEDSSGSHSCLDDDESEPTDAATAAAATEDRGTGVGIDDTDDSEFFDCLDGCDMDGLEVINGIDAFSNESEPGSLKLLTEGKSHGAIAVVISYIFVGKPKMVEIAHSPRNSGDSRRWGLPPPSRPLIVQTTSSLDVDESSSSKSDTQSLAPARPDTTTTTTRPQPTEPEPHFLSQPYATTTVCYSDNNSPNKSTWRGLVRSVSRRRRRTPKEPHAEAPPSEAAPVAAAEPEKVSLPEPKPERAPRRPRGLGLKLSRTARLPGGPPTPITA